MSEREYLDAACTSFECRLCSTPHSLRRPGMKHAGIACGVPDLAGKSGEKDPHGMDAHAPGAKLDAGKLRPWLCFAGFSRALEAVADVTTKGAVKYTPNGWAQVPDGQERYMEAFGRHLLDLGKGKVMDDGPNGTGCRHKAQMIWNLLASLELELRAEAEPDKVIVDINRALKSR